MQRHLPWTVLIALALAGCSSGGGHSLLALEDEKAEMRLAIAQKIGTSPQEVTDALDTTPKRQALVAANTTRKLKDRFGTVRDVPMQIYLHQIGRRLMAATGNDNESVQVVLLNSSQVNAYTPGANTVIISDGLLQFAANEAQVAAVMAHEIAHILLKHPARQKQIKLASKAGGKFMDNFTPQNLQDSLGQFLRLGGNATLNGMIRQQEMMADSIGIDIMVKAGYDPREMVSILHGLRITQPQNNSLANVVYGNHPMTIDRERAVAKKIDKLYQAVAGDVSSPRFDTLVQPYHVKRMKRIAQRN